MGNGADFFSRDERGRRSEYVSVEPAKTINGVKGHVLKRSVTEIHIPVFHIIQTLPMYTSGRM